MNLILDTSILIDIQRKNKESIKKLDELIKIYPAPAKITFITYFEFIHGLRNKSQKNREKLEEFIEKFSIIQTSKETAKILSALKEKYELPLADLLIASQTMQDKGIILTKDKDFERISEMNKIII